MTPAERTARLTVAAIGIALAIAAAVMVVGLSAETLGLRVGIASVIVLPMLWAAATVLVLPANPGGWAKVVGKLILIAYLATGVVLACGLAAVAGRVSAVDLFAVAFSVPLCTHLPTGMICVGYLAVSIGKRMNRQADSDD